MRTRDRRQSPRSIPSRIRRSFNRAKWWLVDVKAAKRNADIAHSAIYIFEGMNNEEGIQKIAEATGMPAGVIANGLDKMQHRENDIVNCTYNLLKGAGD